jgi:hypothetical protein
MVGWWMNDVERIWKEAVVAYSRYSSGCCLEGLKKTTWNITQNSWCPDRDSNRAPIECEWRALPLRQPALISVPLINLPTRDVILFILLLGTLLPVSMFRKYIRPLLAIFGKMPQLKSSRKHVECEYQKLKLFLKCLEYFRPSSKNSFKCKCISKFSNPLPSGKKFWGTHRPYSVLWYVSFL